ncbi:MAG: DNA-binding protein, partial [Tardiphaga sp.]|nr:DNA-binding protein [Tardiphaga sp.]
MNSNVTNLLIAILLLAANAFYVAAEFALVKSRRFRVKAMVEQNRFGARLLQDMLGDIEAYLACCQLGITMASLGLGWVGEPTVSALLKPVLGPLGLSEQALHFTSFLTGFLVFSSLHIVIGEQVPKTLAIRQPEPVSQWIAYPLYASYLMFWPLNWLLNAAARGTLRLLGVQESAQHESLTGTEIEGLVGESVEHGKMESGEAEYIQNVFRFGDLAVSDVMVHRTAMVTLNADLPSEELVREVLATEYTRIPLWRGKSENIIGVLHAKDLLRAIRAVDGDTSKIDVASIALPPWFVPEMRPLSDQLKAFRRRKTHFALVVDEYGEVEGMVTLEDLLEEIVGDISDEHDVVVAGVRAQPDGSVVVDGSVPIRDL